MNDAAQHIKTDEVIARIDGGINIFCRKTGEVIWESPETHKDYGWNNPAPNPDVNSPEWQDALCRAAAPETAAERDRLKAWVADLQSRMFINCVYCGHQYGPNDKVPSSMANVLKAHIEVCPEHPMSKLKATNAKLLAAAKHLFVCDYPEEIDFRCKDCEKARAAIAEAEASNG